MLHFATLLDINYLSRAICLYTSLHQHLATKFTLFILCIDEQTFNYFSKNTFTQIIPILLKDVEFCYPELSVVKANRSKVEYYFTLSPILPLYILSKFEDCKRITTLDADIYFYSSPEIIFDDYGSEDIFITPHDFSANLESLKAYGTYNVSFQSFPNTSNAINLLKDWKTKCIDWCFDRLDSETGNFADQKYLDYWEENFENVKTITQRTCGRAPWNIADSNLSYYNETFWIGDKQLVYYHFHRLRIIGRYIFHNLEAYGVQANKNIKKLYATYILSLLKINEQLHLKTDANVQRYPVSQKKSFFWKLGTDAIVLGNNVIFHRLKFLERAKSRMQNYING